MKTRTCEEICAALARAFMDYANMIRDSAEQAQKGTKLYSYADLAEMMGKSKDTIRQWVCAGEFGEPVKVGNSIRVTQAGVDKFISDHSGLTKKIPSRARKHTTRAAAKPQGQPLGI